MKSMKIKLIFALFLLSFAIPIPAQAQFFKKLKKNVEEKIVQRASDKTDELLNGKEGETGISESEESNPVPSTKKEDTQSGKISKEPTKKLASLGNDDNVITYKAPSKEFIDVVIQSHDGLPRYGSLYFYRGKTAPTNNMAYKNLVELKFLKDAYGDMDRSKLTKYDQTQTGDQKVKNSYFSQQHLLGVASYVCSDGVLKDSFCDSETKSNCVFYDRAGDRKRIGYWGGAGKNEFAQMRSYLGFLKNYFTSLKDWSGTFYKDGTQIAYYVNRAAVAEKYDFKNKGYWISNVISRFGTSFMLHHSGFLPYTENEKALESSGKKFFLSVDPSTAKELNLQERAPVFTVFKVKVYPKIRNHTNVALEFELESQTIEVYRDIALTQKMGEIDIQSLKSKY
ncbi:hypothetical protein [Flagellimonas nanhaiensis]|nr:hypothetical protein [Allomuricauda nanhaiensis]